MSKEAVVTIRAEDRETAEAIERAIRELVPRGTAMRFTLFEGATLDSPASAHVIALTATVPD